MGNLKKAGIVADNYKVKMFKEELAKAGFDKVNVSTYNPAAKLISVKYKPEDFQKIHAVCSLIEAHFKRSN